MMKVEKRIQTHYAEPYQIGFDTMKDLLPSTPTYSEVVGIY